MILSKLKQKILKDFHDFDKFFVFMFSSFFGMFMGYAIGKNVDFTFFIPIFLFGAIYYILFTFLKRSHELC